MAGDAGGAGEGLVPGSLAGPDHDGEHHADASPPALQAAWVGAGRVVAVATELAGCLGGLMHDPGRAGDGPALEQLGRTYRQLRRDVDRFFPLLAELRLATPNTQESPADGEGSGAREEVVDGAGCSRSEAGPPPA